MATENLDAVNLAAVPLNGVIKEDVMDAINSISPVDRPFSDAVGSKTSGNAFTEWVSETLETANEDNARVDGSSSAGINDTVTGERLGNYHQIATKTVRVSDRGRNSDTIGSGDELIRQLSRRQKALRRDEEARLVSRKPAVAGDGNTIAGETAGVGSWIGTNQGSTNTIRGVGGADPILSGNPGGYPVTGPAAGTPVAGTESGVKAMMRAAYEAGGNPTMAMSTPSCIEQFSDYLFTSSARVATIDTTVSQSNRTNNGSGAGRSGGGVVAQGAVNIFVTNYGTLELVPNRFQSEVGGVGSDVADLYLLDPELWERSYLQGYQTEELARDGLAENREISVDFALCSLNSEGNAIVADIDTSLAFTA